VLLFHQSLLERVRRLPGVSGAALVSTAPGTGPNGDRVFTIVEKPAPSYSLQYDAMTLTADPQYFSVMQIPLLRGRVFTEHERLHNDHYVVVSRQFVNQFLAGDDPIGKHIRDAWDDKVENYEIIGEVGDTLYDVTKPVSATIYFPILSGIPDRTSEATIMVHASVDPLAISTPVQQQISALEPELPVYNALTMDPDPQQDHGEPGLRRKPGAGLRGHLAAAGRCRALWSALLPGHAALRRDRHPHRARGAAA